jgi:hypothetical protein
MTTSIIDTGVAVRSAGYAGRGTLDGNAVRSMGIANHVAGFFTSDGNAVEILCGFRANRVQIFNETDSLGWMKLFGMAAANTIKTVEGGSLAETLDTTSAILVNDLTGGSWSVTLSAEACGTAKKICYYID